MVSYIERLMQCLKTFTYNYNVFGPIRSFQSFFEASLNLLRPLIKGSVQWKLRPRLLYIIWKLFKRKWSTEHLNLILLKGQLTIY